MFSGVFSGVVCVSVCLCFCLNVKPCECRMFFCLFCLCILCVCLRCSRVFRGAQVSAPPLIEAVTGTLAAAHTAELCGTDSLCVTGDYLLSPSP